MSETAKVIRAAGGIIERSGAAGVEILLIHRTRYSPDEWALPKGKADPGESPEETALREVREETGCEVRLGELAGVLRYPVSGRPKEVFFYRMTLMKQSERQDTREVQSLRWTAPEEAIRVLSYSGERDLVARIYRLGDSA